MFFKPRYIRKSDVSIGFSKNTEIIIPECETAEYIREKLELYFAKACPGDIVASRIEFCAEIPEDIKVEVNAAGNIEEFAIEAGEVTRVYASDSKGFIVALSALMDGAVREPLKKGLIYDYPELPTRGYRAFLPSHDEIDDFINTLDFLVRYRYTSIVLEIGGAMEYERHPEINSVWVEYCKDMKRYSGRTHEIQDKTYPWRKNSIHCDNGGGSYLTKTECKRLAAECKRRGIEIVPECPTFSHCDYIVMAHPELRERLNDMHADTYCPSNPDTYKLVFDIFDEVIEVFEPKSINIGHDELYSIGICEKCKDKIPWRVFVEDVERLSEYLASKGIATLMWADKLLNAQIGGTGFGGARIESVCCGVPVTIPPTYHCADYMPKGITYMHWYYTYCPDSEFHDRGYPVGYGNLNHLWGFIYNWRERVNAGIIGGWVSNWGSTKFEYFQRNCLMAELCASAYALSSPDYDTTVSEKIELTERVMSELAAYRRECEGDGNKIAIIHTTNARIPYHRFVDGVFIEDEKYEIGKYLVEYTDGTTCRLSVKFGTNIGSAKLPLEDIIENGIGARWLDIGEYVQLAYSTSPIHENGQIYYLTEYDNPYPEKTVSKINYENFNKLVDVKFAFINETADESKLHRVAKELGNFNEYHQFTEEEWGKDRDMFTDQ